MNRLRILGFVFIAVIAFGAVAATAALAAEEWLDNGAAIPAAIPVLSEVMVGLQLLDIGANTEVECMVGDDAGTVGPGAADTTTTAECLEALPVSGLCSAPVTIKALELPWKSTLFLVVEGGVDMYRVLVENATTKLIGYETECETVLGKQKDACVGPAVSFLAENDGTTGTVLLETDAVTATESKAGTCSLSGGKPEVLAGSDTLIFSDEGLLITVSG
jgi:hypothetical protein